MNRKPGPGKFQLGPSFQVLVVHKLSPVMTLQISRKHKKTKWISLDSHNFLQMRHIFCTFTHGFQFICNLHTQFFH